MARLQCGGGGSGAGKDLFIVQQAVRVAPTDFQIDDQITINGVHIWVLDYRLLSSEVFVFVL